MKLSSLLPSAAVALMTVAVLAATTGVQATQDQPQPAAPQNQPAVQTTPNPPAGGAPTQNSAPGGRPMRNYPPPTNLKVLPKNLTGREVREIMEKWAGSLGVHCDFCHVAIPTRSVPTGGRNWTSRTIPNRTSRSRASCTP